MRSPAWLCAALVAAAVLLVPAIATAAPSTASQHARPAGGDRLGIVALQQAELHAFDAAYPDQFGCAIAISGNTALVGARQKSVGGLEEAGAAYVFVRSGATWKLQQKLVASDPGDSDGFGSTVALSGDTALIGAPAKTVAGYSVAGAAYVFVRSGSTWSQQAELQEPSPATSDMFGSAVALSGTTALIGAGGATVADQTATDQPGAGAVYVFSGSGATWTEQTRLVNPEPTANAYFGDAIAVSGGTALIGAPAGSLGSPHGTAYIFEGSGATWSQQARFVAFDQASDDCFGWAVALSGDTALVGAPGITVGTNDFAGAAYVFTRTGTDWMPEVELQATDETAGDQFGCSLALSGTRALIGASGESELGPILPAQAPSTGGARALALTSHAGGATYVFDGSGASWSQDRELTAADAVPNDRYGEAVALSGTTALIGACDKTVGAAGFAGAVYAESFAAPALTLTASPRAVQIGKTVTLRGVVKNFVPTATAVRLWHRVGTHTTLLKTVKISASGVFRWTVRPRKAGKLVLVATYKAGGLTFKSKATTVTVRR